MRTLGDINVIVIGRNEGQRLLNCFDTLLQHCAPASLVYVDSGSTDESALNAQALGIHTIRLSSDRPFTAARARNAGFESLLDLGQSQHYVQFLDGDCILQGTWLQTAITFLEDHPDVAICSGHRREIKPDASVYNTLCDLEWGRYAGEVKACGGDFMIRSKTYREVGGFNEELVAGEEPEMCLRIRRLGYTVWRLNETMVKHDAAMRHFSQWYQRAKRSGYAYAQGAAIHGCSKDRYNVRELLSVVAWGGLIPILLIGFAFFIAPVFSFLVLIYPIKGGQVFFRNKPAYGPRLAAYYAVHVIAAKFPQFVGVCSYVRRIFFRRSHTLVEYK